MSFNVRVQVPQDLSRVRPGSGVTGELERIRGKHPMLSIRQVMLSNFLVRSGSVNDCQ